MLHSLSLITGASIHASDGAIGSVSDFYFEDSTWTIRYLVVDAGNWLARRHVLLAVSAVDQIDWDKPDFRVRLTRDQVRHSPDIDTQKPVSRQQEIAMHRYFGWPTYCNVRFPTGRYTAEMEYPSDTQGDPHLRSAWHISGYSVWARDGEVGKIEDYVMDDGAWHINYLIVEAGNWLNARSLLVSTHGVESISWANRRLDLSAPRVAV